MKPRVLLAGTYIGLGLIGVSAAPHARPMIVWNASASAPIGFYRIVGLHQIRAGDLVLVRTPPDLAPLFAARGYIPSDVPLLKRIAAVEGSTICRDGMRLSIDGRDEVVALRADGRGRLLPVWSGCRKLGPGEVFLLMADVPGSLDGRYFGPTPISSIIGKAVPLWIWRAS
ncbi:MAG TPA: S26 family signal peptidase [Alphaproteobacteria bacterium]|nr:S26 family signal peptidase [Alphaproteobacteria bacterium]